MEDAARLTHYLLPAVPACLPGSWLQGISLGTFTPDCVLIAKSLVSTATSELRDRVTLPHNFNLVHKVREISSQGASRWKRYPRQGVATTRRTLAIKDCRMEIWLSWLLFAPLSGHLGAKRTCCHVDYVSPKTSVLKDLTLDVKSSRSL